MISKLDFLAVPSPDAERSRAFYVDTLGLRPDDNARFEFWAGETCFGIYEPAQVGMEFAPPKRLPPGAARRRRLGRARRARVPRASSSSAT